MLCLLPYRFTFSARALLRRAFVCGLLAVLVSVGTAAARQLGTVSGGYGFSDFRSDDLEHFASTFNASADSLIASRLQPFGRAYGWHFDVGYETFVHDDIGLTFGSGLHRYADLRSVAFKTGASHDLELSVQDLSTTWELNYYGRRFFYGPLFWVSHRRVTLASRNGSSASSPLADVGLVGDYTASQYETRWGGTIGIWSGDLKLGLRALSRGAVLGSDDFLFDGDLEHVETDSGYFPRDYGAFLENGVGRSGRRRGQYRNAASSNVRGPTWEIALAVTFPI